MQSPRFALRILADDTGAGQGLLCLWYLWLRVQQLISARKSLPGVPALPAADIEGERASGVVITLHVMDLIQPSSAPGPAVSPALGFMSP